VASLFLCASVALHTNRHHTPSQLTRTDVFGPITYTIHEFFHRNNTQHSVSVNYLLPFSGEVTPISRQTNHYKTNKTSITIQEKLTQKKIQLNNKTHINEPNKYKMIIKNNN
jgi:hypothetical protein